MGWACAAGSRDVPKIREFRGPAYAPAISSKDFVDSRPQRGSKPQKNLARFARRKPRFPKDSQDFLQRKGFPKREKRRASRAFFFIPLRFYKVFCAIGAPECKKRRASRAETFIMIRVYKVS